MATNYFLEYTLIKVQTFKDKLIQHLDYVDKVIAERTPLIREYDNRVNERVMQTQEGKVDMVTTLDAGLVVTESSGMESGKQDESIRSGNDTNGEGANIKPFYDKEPMAEVQSTARYNIFSYEQQHDEQPKFNNEGWVDQDAEQCHEKYHLIASLNTNKTTKLSNHISRIVQRVCHHRQQRNLLVSNEMIHNYYSKEARKKTQERISNSKASVMSYARLQNTASSSKPKPRSNNQASRNWPASKSSCVTSNVLQIADHSRNSIPFSDTKHFVCSTCQKCVFNANHDACIRKFLKNVNSCAKVQSHKIANKLKPVEQKSNAKKPERHISKGYRFSPNKTSAVHEKKKTPRSCLRWKPTGRIFKNFGLRWIPTGKMFVCCTSKIDCKPPHGSNTYISNIHECKQTLDLSAGTLALVTGIQNQ
ncbi:hypothetical protein Tco_0852872 [Tanacetum coccineum]